MYLSVSASSGEMSMAAGKSHLYLFSQLAAYGEDVAVCGGSVGVDVQWRLSAVMSARIICCCGGYLANASAYDIVCRHRLAWRKRLAWLTSSSQSWRWRMWRILARGWKLVSRRHWPSIQYIQSAGCLCGWRYVAALCINIVSAAIHQPSGQLSQCGSIWPCGGISGS